MNTLIILLIAFTGCSYATEKPGRVISGNYAPSGSYQYMVSLRNNKLDVICGGAIITYYWVITSGQCKDATIVSTGDVKIDQQCFYNIEKKVIHPSFDAKTLQNDVMMVKLTKSFNYYYSTIYPTYDTSYTQNMNLTFKFTGWGQYYPNSPLATSLVQADYKLISSGNCTLENSASGSNLPFNPDIQMCGTMNKTLPTGAGICNGDIGGPLIYNGYYLVGIASRPMKHPCGSEYPDVFVRVSFYYNWIYSIINYS